MKPSRYNCFYAIDDAAILGYNTFTTALLSLNDAQFAGIQEFYADPTDSVFERLDLVDLRDGLVEAGMLVPDDLDEHAQVAASHMMARTFSRHLSLTLMPTLDCNFRCNYCFSYARHGHMTDEVQDALLHFVEPKLSQADALSIAWYGGEPTLCPDIIERLAERLHALAAQHHVTSGGDSIVTNGYRLTRQMGERLRAAGATRAQVTLDGARVTHDSRRPLAGGQPTFDRVLGNLMEVHDLLEIMVRINIDRANAETAVAVLDALDEAGLRGKVKPYFAHVRQYSDACGDIAGACFTDREFSVLEIELTKLAMLRGFSSFNYPESQLAGVCGACHPLTYVVAPDGMLFKCWAEASWGPDWSVGNLLAAEPTPVQGENLRSYLDWNPSADPECGECRMLPICMGGCPHLRLRHPGQVDCAPWRYVLGESLGIRSKLSEASRVFSATVEQDASMTVG